MCAWSMNGRKSGLCPVGDFHVSGAKLFTLPRQSLKTHIKYHKFEVLAAVIIKILEYDTVQSCINYLAFGRDAPPQYGN